MCLGWAAICQSFDTHVLRRSPEYEWGPGDGDTNYELGLCKWGLRTSLAAAATLNLTAASDPRLGFFDKL